MQAIVTTTTKSPATSSQPVMVPSNKLNEGPQTMKVIPIGQDKKVNRKGKGFKPPEKGKKNVVKTTAVATTLASSSANLRSKLQDKAKHTAVLIQEITEELQAIEEESLNGEHDSEATQESNMEQDNSENYLTDDDQ